MLPTLGLERSPRQPLAILALTLLFGGTLGLVGPAARAQEEEETPATPQATAPAPQKAKDAEPAKKPIFQVQRIELSVFGGPFGGATYLELPDISDVDRTHDLGATDILDFNGQPLRGGVNHDEPIRAPKKKLDGGVIFGGAATFYLGERFGLALRGAYGKTQATVTGFTDSDRAAAPSGQAPQAYEWARSDISIYQFGTSMVYQIGKAHLRPWVSLGFGGILNSFPQTDDMGALYFMYGGGLRYPISNKLVAHIGLESTLYSYKNDEILFDQTITLPMITLGVSWKHDVPPSAAPPTPAAGS